MQLRMYLQRGVSSVVVCTAVVAAAQSDQPTPSPTPVPQASSLAEYASQVRLSESVVAADGAVISNETVRELAEQSSMTIVHRPAAEVGPVSTPRPVDPRSRAKWQRAFARQRDVVARLVNQRADLEAERVALRRRGGLSPAVLARLDVLQENIERLDREIATARNRLDVIVRDARRDGATPGWFRGL